MAADDYGHYCECILRAVVKVCGGKNEDVSGPAKAMARRLRVAEELDRVITRVANSASETTGGHLVDEWVLSKYHYKNDVMVDILEKAFKTVASGKPPPVSICDYVLGDDAPFRYDDIYEIFMMFGEIQGLAKCYTGVPYHSNDMEAELLKKITVMEAIYVLCGRPLHQFTRMRAAINAEGDTGLEEVIYPCCDVLMWGMVRMRVKDLRSLYCDLQSPGDHLWEERTSNALQQFSFPAFLYEDSTDGLGDVLSLMNKILADRYGATPIFNPTDEQAEKILAYVHMTTYSWVTPKTPRSPPPRPAWGSDADVPPLSFQEITQMHPTCVFIKKTGGRVSLFDGTASAESKHTRGHGATIYAVESIVQELDGNDEITRRYSQSPTEEHGGDGSDVFELAIDDDSPTGDTDDGVNVLVLPDI